MKTLLVIAALVVSLNGFAENKSDNFVYNDVYNTQNMVSARTVYRSMDSSLQLYRQYIYKYDENGRIVEKEAEKWDTFNSCWTPDYQLSIPSFQRAYIWKPENILQLISDLEEACKSPETPYFLGSLILVREGDTSFSVIDGQQRLVSLSIIIAALRDLEHDEEWMRLLDALIVEPGDKLRGITSQPRLTLRERDAAFFREYVQEGNLEALFDMNDEDCSSNAQCNIIANTKQAYDALAQLDEEERHRFASYLVNSVTLVIVTTDGP